MKNRNCRSRALVTAMAAVLSTGIPASVHASPLTDAYTAGMQARGDGDLAGYREGMQRALEIDPSHPILHQHMARAEAQLGHLDEAAVWIHSALQLGADFDLGEDPFLEPMHADPRWESLLREREASRDFVGTNEVRLDLGRGDLLTESFAFDSRDRSFYFGSVAERSIVRVTEDGSQTDFVSTEEFGLPPVLGVKLDLDRNWLWALGNADSSLFAYSTGLRTGVWAFDLASGELAGRWYAPEDSAQHNFNDLVLDEDGHVYVTDGYLGVVFRLSAGEGNLEALCDPGQLAGPNGICYEAARGLLYVAEYPRGVHIFDLRHDEDWALQTPSDWTLIGIDGLYSTADGDLVSIQNGMGMSRVARVRLSEDRRRVVSGTTLQANHPASSDPTTGVLVDRELWYIVNSHIASYAQNPERLSDFAPTIVLRVGLDPS